MNDDNWKASLREFFAQRGHAVNGRALNLEELAYVSGRDPRVWTAAIYDDLISDILRLTGADASTKLLEVGCASGFLALGLAPKVTSYDGLDLADPALSTARQIGLKNAHFTLGDGAALPYPDNYFDASLCYDVFTNFPSFQVGADLIGEMLRTTRPGGNVLIGSIPDHEKRDAYAERVVEVALELQERHGPLSQHYLNLGGVADSDRRPWWTRVFSRPPVSVNASIECFYFEKQDFLKLGKQLAAECRIAEVHALNPYRGFRFNVIYTKPFQ